MLICTEKHMKCQLPSGASRRLNASHQSRRYYVTDVSGREEFRFRGLPRLLSLNDTRKHRFTNEADSQTHTHSAGQHYKLTKIRSDNMSAAVCAFILTFSTVCGSRGKTALFSSLLVVIGIVVGPGAKREPH